MRTFVFFALLGALVVPGGCGGSTPTPSSPESMAPSTRVRPPARERRRGSWPPDDACSEDYSGPRKDLCVRVGGLMQFDGNAVFAAAFRGSEVTTTGLVRIRSGLADLVLGGALTGGADRLRFFVDHDGDSVCTSPADDAIFELALPAAEGHLVQTRVVSLRQRVLDPSACAWFEGQGFEAR